MVSLQEKHGARDPPFPFPGPCSLCSLLLSLDLCPRWQPKLLALLIHTVHANIKEPQFDIEWFQSFDIVLNPLNNLGESIRISTRLLCDVL